PPALTRILKIDRLFRITAKNLEIIIAPFPSRLPVLPRSINRAIRHQTTPNEVRRVGTPVAEAMNHRLWRGERRLRRLHYFLRQNGFVATQAENGKPRPPAFTTDCAVVALGLSLVPTVDPPNEFIPRGAQFTALRIARVPK